MKWTFYISLFILFLHCPDRSMGFTNPNGYIENKGQIIDQNQKYNTEVKYLFLSDGLNIQLRSNSFSYDIYSLQKFELLPHSISKGIPEKFNPKADSSIYNFHRIDINFIGANTNPKITAHLPTEHLLNYYTNSTTEKGITGVRIYKKIIYHDLYPGINLEFEFDPNSGHPKYNFILQPGADISIIRWTYAGSVSSAIEGNTIQLGSNFGNIEETIPESFEMLTRKPVDIRYTLIGKNTFGYTSPLSYNKQSTLIIDPLPQRIWGTYLGGPNEDRAFDVFTNSAGNIFITGNTSSLTNIATSGAHQSSFQGGSYGDIFLAKCNSQGFPIWSTYLGGDKGDHAVSITCDSIGDIYISGTSTSSNMATAGAHQTTNNGDPYFHRYYGDAYLAKFTNDGVRLWATYYGGDAPDIGNDIVIDKSGNVVMTGLTMSQNNISTSGAHQDTLGAYGKWEGYIAKFSPSGSLIWGTYYGGELQDLLFSITTDNENNIYVGGHSSSSLNIATPGAHQTSFEGEYDVMLIKFQPNGTRVWATYFGYNDYDDCIDITIDYENNIYLTGRTYSQTNFSTPGCYQPNYGGGGEADAYLAKFNSSGSLLWSTYIGGVGNDAGNGVTCDASGYVYLVGNTNSYSGISDSTSFQKTLADSGDIMLFKFNKNGNKEWSTYYGGNGAENGSSAFTTGKDYLYVTGSTSSFNSISSAGSYQPSFAGYTYDGFLLKLSLGCPDNPQLNNPVKTHYCEGDSVLLYCSNPAWEKYQWMRNGVPIPNATNVSFHPMDSGYYSLETSLANGCKATSGAVQIQTSPYPQINLRTTGDTSFCEDKNFTLIADAIGGNSFQWFKNKSAITGATSDRINIQSDGSYFVVLSNTIGCSDSSAEVNIQVLSTPNAELRFLGDTTFCSGNFLTLTTDTANGYNFQWFRNNNLLSGDSLSSYTAYTSGRYHVLVTNAVNCSKTSAAVDILVHPLPPVSIVPNSTAYFCKNENLIIRANYSPTITYQWIKDGWPLAVADSNILITNTPGSYYVIEKNEFNCVDSSSSIQVLEHPIPVAGEIEGPTVIEPLKEYTYSIPFQTGYSYQWELQKGALIKGQESNEITVRWWGTNMGKVKVTITDGNGCKAISDTLVQMNYNPFDYFYIFKIYPNPVNDSLILLTSENLDQAVATVEDVAGRHIYNAKFTGNGNKYSIPVHTLSSGTYILTVKWSGSVQHHWFIKI